MTGKLESAKKAFLNLLFSLGAQNPARYMLRKSIIILAYHGFTEKILHDGIENHQGKHLNAEIFCSHVKFLKKYYNVVPLDYIVRSCKEGAVLADNTVAITIDDGYESAYALAYPILRKEGIPAAVFVTTNFVDGKEPIWVDRLEYAINRTKERSLRVVIGGRNYLFGLGDLLSKKKCEARLRLVLKCVPRPSLDGVLDGIEESLGEKLFLDSGPEIYRPLEWSQITEMAKSGIVSIGSHTHNHAILTRVSHKAMKEELTVSKRLIEQKTGAGCALFCYPNGGKGDFDDDTKKALKEAGYSCGLINIPGANSMQPDLYELRRFGFGKDADLAELAMTVSGIARLPAVFKQSVTGLAPRRALSAEEAGVSQEGAVAKAFDSSSKTYADKYAGSSIEGHSFTARREKVCGLLGGVGAGKVLDIGCGPGIMAERMTEKGFEFYGVDVSKEMVARCRERYGQLKDAHFYEGRIEALDFPDYFFDVILCMGIMEYIGDDEEALRELSRVIKPGGTAIITLPNKYSPYRLWHRIVFNKEIARFIKKALRRRSPTLFHREYGEREYSSLLERYGFKVTDTVYYNFNLFLFPFDIFFSRLAALVSGKLEPLGRGRARRLGTGFIVKAVKK